MNSTSGAAVSVVIPAFNRGGEPASRPGRMPDDIDDIVVVVVVVDGHSDDRTVEVAK